MKHYWIIPALGCALVAAPAPARAQGNERTINVTGSATLSLRPDTGRLTFSVVTVAPTLEAARNQNAAAMQKAMVALRGLGLPESRTTTRSDGSLETTPGLALRTGDLSVSLIYSDATNRLEVQRILGYRVTNTAVARFTDRDSDKLGAVMSRIVDTALKSGANQISSVEFSLRDDGEAEQRAMVAALANARLKAETLAREAGVRLRGVRSISQASYGFQVANFRNQQGGFGGGMGDSETPLVAGSLLFNGSVTVSYDISP